jgi:hypothetical protein
MSEDPRGAPAYLRELMRSTSWAADEVNGVIASTSRAEAIREAVQAPRRRRSAGDRPPRYASARCA